MGILCIFIIIQLVELSIAGDKINDNLNSWPIFIMKSIKISLDMSIHILFLHLFIYIMKMKHANAKEENN